MRAILLAAGFGSRLRPITDNIPKCLVPIGGKPLLQYWFENLFNGGVKNILVNTHYLAEQVEDFIMKSKWSEHVEITFEEELLGTAGTLLANHSIDDNSPVMLVHADNLSVFQVKRFTSVYENRPQNALMTMMTFLTDQPERCGIVEIGEDGIVSALHEKCTQPPSALANGAVYILSPELITELLNQNVRPSDFSTEVLPLLMGKINTYHNSIYHRDIGNFDSLEQANQDIHWLQSRYNL